MARLMFRLAAAGALFWPALARAQDALPQDFLEAQLDEHGRHCEPHGQQQDGSRVLVACGAAGVWQVLLEASGPRFVRSFEQAGDVVGFFREADGRLWVKLRVLEARPFSNVSGASGGARFPDDSLAAPAPAAPPPPVAPAAPTAPAASPTPPVPHGVGRVIRVEPGTVVVSLGSSNGVSRSDRIELSVAQNDEGSVDSALSREVIAIGVVTHVAEGSARVRLGMNESVPLGAAATPTRALPTASLSAPPRAAQFSSFAFTLRPFAAIGQFGGGALVSGAVGRRFGAPFHLQAIFDPLAVAAVQDDRTITVANAAIIASYDARFFEMGFGLGGQTVNATKAVLDPGSGLSLVQLIRLGAEDGLNITARTSVVLFHQQFGFGGMVASLQIPVTNGYWLTLAGGGGDVGYGYGEVGLRALLAGNGGAGSKFLYVSAGGAGVFQSRTACFSDFCGFSTLSYAGPMAGVGGEWRF